MSVYTRDQSWDSSESFDSYAPTTYSAALPRVYSSYSSHDPAARQVVVSSHQLARRDRWEYAPGSVILSDTLTRRAEHYFHWDLRFPPVYDTTTSGSATIPSTQFLRIISKDMPWSIDVYNRDGLTIFHVLFEIYQSLQRPLTTSEWWLARNDRHRWSMTRACQERLATTGSGDARVLRVDWLGHQTAFRYLKRDHDFARERMLPGQEDWVDTWALKLGRT